MNIKTLEDLILKEIPEAYETYMKKAFEYQNKKNDKRPLKNRFNEARVGREVREMWNMTLLGIFNSLKASAKDSKVSIEAFIYENEILDDLSDNLANTNFEEE